MDGKGRGKSRIQLDGVIGQNVLSRFNYLLDYQHRALTLQDRSEEIMGSRGGALPCRKGSSRCEIRVLVGVNGLPTSLFQSVYFSNGQGTVLLNPGH